MSKILISVCVALSLTGCAQIQGGLGAAGLGQGSAVRSVTLIDGVQYRAKTTKNKENPRLFSINVNPISANPDAAKEAGRNAATRYCLLTFGGSDTDWISGPDAPLSELLTDGENLTMRGRCTQR